VASVPFFGDCQWRLTPTRVRRRVVLPIDRLGVYALVVGTYAITALCVPACFGDHAFQASDDPPLLHRAGEEAVRM